MRRKPLSHSLVQRLRLVLAHVVAHLGSISSKNRFGVKQLPGEPVVVLKDNLGLWIGHPANPSLPCRTPDHVVDLNNAIHG